MSEETQTMTAAAGTLAGELTAELARAERIADHYNRDNQHVSLRMIERDISQARVAMNVGNETWMRKALAALRSYEV